VDIISFKQYCEYSSSINDLFLKDGRNIWIELISRDKFDCCPPLNLSSNSDANLFLNSPIPHLYDLVHEVGQVGLASLADITLATPHGLLFDNNFRLIAESYHN